MFGLGAQRNRIVGSALMPVAGVMSRQWKPFTAALSARRSPYALDALFIDVNWFTYVWAVNTGGFEPAAVLHQPIITSSGRDGLANECDHSNGWRWVLRRQVCCT